MYCVLYCRVMGACPLCSVRAAKRYCPAKHADICSVCCGTKREVEIDCPSNCVYLKTGRSYEALKQVPDAESVERIRRFDNTFFYQFSAEILTIYRAIFEERAASPAMADRDVIEVYRSLMTTMKTLSSGLYYDSMPEGGLVPQALFRKVKPLLETLMAPQEGGRRSLRVSEVLEILEFLITTAELNSSNRPKSRRYLDWLHTILPVPDESSRLIVP